MAQAWAERLGSGGLGRDVTAWAALLDLARDFERERGVDLGGVCPPLTRLNDRYVLPGDWGRADPQSGDAEAADASGGDASYSPAAYPTGTIEPPTPGWATEVPDWRCFNGTLLERMVSASSPAGWWQVNASQSWSDDESETGEPAIFPASDVDHIGLGEASEVAADLLAVAAMAGRGPAPARAAGPEGAGGFADPLGRAWASERAYLEADAAAHGCAVPYPEDVPPPSWADRADLWEGDRDGWSGCHWADFADGLAMVTASARWDGRRVSHDQPSLLIEDRDGLGLEDALELRRAWPAVVEAMSQAAALASD
jgi:hypothetical protein